MKQFYCFSIKRHLRPLIIVIVLLLGHITVNAQCYAYSLNAYKVSPSYEITSPTWVTLRADMDNEFAGQQNMSWGRILWYYQETGGEPFALTEVATNQWSYSSTVEFNATYGVTVWYCYYDYWTNCETERKSYEFPYLNSNPPIPSVYMYWDYGYVCGNVARFKVTSNATATLYKQSALGGNNYDYITSSGSGYFEIPDYNPNTQYFVGASNSVSSVMFGVSLDYYSNQPLPVTGTKTILTGNTTTLSENSGYNFSNIRWFDVAGNLLYDGVPFTTPVLTANTTYQVRGYNYTPDGGTCVTDPGYVTIQVNQPPVPVTCDRSIDIYQTYPATALCYPQTVTLTAEMYNETVGHDGMAWGMMNFYYQETGGNPFSSQEVATNWYTYSRSVDVYANTGVTVWVSYKDLWTGCESPRIPYEFYISPTPYLYVDYAYACGNVAKVKVTSNAGVNLYKQIPGGNNYEYLQNVGSTFEITNYDPGASYALMASSSCSSGMYPLSFDVFPTAAPLITGNTTLSAGGSTTLTADNGYYYDYKWYDGSGNFLYHGYQYTTPALSENIYTYKVQAVTDGNICVSDQAVVTVTVTQPPITYTNLYNSTNFTKTIDLGKVVGTIHGVAGTTATGAATYNIPVYTPPGTNGLAPSVSISYSSQAGNGVVGFGWNITGLSIIGRTGKNMYHNDKVSPVTYTNEDAFLLDGSRLNAINGVNGGNGTIYAAEMEAFSKIVSNGGSANNPDWFLVTAKNGSQMEFGNTADSRLLTDDGANVMCWRLNKITDTHGNYIEFKYNNANRDSRIDEINYTGNTNASLLPYNTIKFNYEVRSDAVITYVGGATMNAKHLLKSITVKNDGSTVKTYGFNYGYDSFCSLLKEVTESGSDGSSLNSTIFLYGDKPANFSLESSSVVAGNAVDIYTGDYDGDGISDILAASYEYSDFFKYNTDYKIYSRSSANDAFQLKYTVPLNNTFQLVNKKDIPFGRNFISSDFDGDGRDDILLTQSHIQNVSSGTRRIDGIQINFSRDQPTNFTTVGYALPTVFDIWGNSICTLFDPPGNYIIPGDFDGDGANDYILVTRQDGGAGSYYCFFNSPKRGIVNGVIQNNGVSAGAISAADDIMPVDFDGDAKMELMVIIDNQTYIISVGDNNELFYPYKMDVIYQTSRIHENCNVFSGDFDGDRKTDLLVRNPNAGWYILYSTGKSFIEKAFGFNQSVNISDHKVLVSDFNGDGKSDVLHGYNYFVGGIATTSKLSVYYSKGNVATSEFVYEQIDYNKLLGFTPAVVADLNGDGRSDVINRNYYADPFDIISFYKNGKERMLAGVLDGHKNRTSINYKTLTDKTSSPFVYNRTVSLDNTANQYPFNYVQLPMLVVSSVSASNGVGGTNTVGFSYEDAIVHRPAKGFLGFKKITTQDFAKGTVSITENQINSDFAIPYTVKQTTQLAGGNLISESSINTSFISLSTGATDPNRFVQLTDLVLNVDHLSGAASETSNTYDNYGNIVTNVSKTGSLSGSTVNAVETVTTTTTYGTYSTPVPALPETVTVDKVRTGMPGYSATTTSSYNSNGSLASQTVFSGKSKAITSNYTYNSFGNVILVTTSSPGLTTRNEGTTYDSKGRFALTKQNGTANTSRSETYTFDSKWGKVLSHTSTDCLTTTYEYDGFGRLKKTNVPDNYSLTTTLNWDEQNDVIFYALNTIPGKPTTKIWYDKLGRETKKQTSGFNNQWLTKVTTYNAAGNISAQTNDYYATEAPLTTTNTFDAYNRPETVSNSLNTTSYTYTKLSGGKIQVTTQNASGQSASRITDATGKVVSAIDNGGQIDFTYNSQGLQTQVSHGGAILVTTDYDLYGKQTTVTDKNAGTVNYEYDAFGQLIRQTDNNGNTYTMTYDDFGRIINRQGPEGPATWEYYKDAATGCNNDNIVKQTGNNGVVKEYSYSSTKRLESEKITVDNFSYVTSFTYDNYGNLLTTTYPSGVVVNNNYDNNGTLVSVTGGNAASPTTLFTGSKMNSFGQYTQYTLGNNRQGLHDYHYGIPTRFYTNGIQDLNLNFNYTTGNLLSRQDMVKGVTESFDYDNLNRLTKCTVNGQVQLNIDYDNNGGQSWGNITAKTDAGNYVYRNDKIHAVAYITNPAGAQSQPVTIPTTSQVITYTPFLKTASIEEGGYLQNFTYDPDHDRIKTIYQQGGTTLETRYFLGDYEKQVKGSATREIHYVSGGNGLCAIIVRENGINNFYFLYTDHLGSLLTITDINGNVVAEQNFDAWGRKRNPANWQYAAVPAVQDWLYRGYTGHEHLPAFGIINMNGRLYDPIQGRMLSPDNYVPSPFSTQGYNRYSYAHNNPLTFVDADGNFPWVAIAIAAAVSAGTSAAVYSISADMNGTWSWRGFLRATAMGAVSGAIGGTIAQAGIAMGASAQSLGFNIFTNAAAQISTNIAFGNEITPGMIAGAMLSGIVSHGFGNFKGVAGSVVENIAAEIVFNGIKHGIAGAVGGSLGAIIDGGDVADGFMNGAWTGAVGGMTIGALNIATMGPAYKPDMKYEDFGRYAPVYRSGTFLTRTLFGAGSGVTLGRNLVTHLMKGPMWNDFNQYLQAHETAHYIMSLKVGFGKMYPKILKEYAKYGQLETYVKPGCMEWGANMYSALRLGFYYEVGFKKVTIMPIIVPSVK